jgi:phage recombination protein Bet
MNAVVEHKPSVMALSEVELLQVLQSSLFPGAAVASLKMVLGYCKAAGLDPMQKPVHIVPMWDPKAGQMRDVVMPGINLYRTQASRSEKMAGISDPEFGPMVTQNIGGQEITFPEWCRITVKRVMFGGSIAEFSATEFWMENYATKGGKEKSIAPNAMWTKRPRGQLAKCTEAQALRKAFPEFSGAATAEEMEGKTISADDAAAGGPNAEQTLVRTEALAAVAAAKTLDDLKPLGKTFSPKFRASGDSSGYELFADAMRQRGAAIRAAMPPEDKTATGQTETQAPAPAEATAAGGVDPWVEELAAAEASAKQAAGGTNE